MQLEKQQWRRLIIGLMIVAVVVLESVMLVVYWRICMIRERAELVQIEQRDPYINLPLLPMKSIRHEFNTPYTPAPSISLMPQQQSSSVAIPMYTTSSAIVHHIGGGGSAAPVASSINSSVANNSHSTSAIVVPTIVWASSRSLTAANTIQAERELIRSNGPAQPINNDPKGGLPPEPFPDDPVESPVGSMGMLFVLAAGYGIAVLVRKNKFQTTKNM